LTQTRSNTHSYTGRSPSHGVGDPYLGDENVVAEVDGPPVALVRGRPETPLLGGNSVNGLARGVVFKHTARGGCIPRGKYSDSVGKNLKTNCFPPKPLLIKFF
jgi:hypothetical protein